jgi:hypothetical protein
MAGGLALQPNTGGIALAAGLSVLLLAVRGFGESKPKGWKAQAKAAGAGKLKPCLDCAGTGKKPCQFCKGTKFMKGFLGDCVSCVPCQATGTLGITCKGCSGLGFLP